jgi:GDP-L-fucose synthase
MLRNLGACDMGLRMIDSTVSAGDAARARAARVFVAGHRGLVGSAIVRALGRAGFETVLTAGREDLDLREQADVRRWFERERPEVVYLAAGRVGGIVANDTYPADFARDNLLIATNVIDAAWRTGARKLVNFASSCMYPRLCEQPMREEMLLTGALEPTNAAYAAAKIAGVEMVRGYAKQHGFDAINLLPANLYGPGDNFDPAAGHVVPAMLGRFHDAKRAGAAAVTVWGTGRPEREFLFVDDLADAALFLAERLRSPEVINVGSGEGCTIGQLAEAVRDVVGFEGRLEFDTSRPDGMPRKLLDSTRVHALGWRAHTSLREGLARTYAWMLENAQRGREGASR